MVDINRTRGPRIKDESARDRISRVMWEQYGAWLSETVMIDLYRFTNQHQQFYVRLCPSKAAAVVYSFHKTIDLSRPAIDPIPGA